MTAFPITPIRPTAHPTAARDLGAMGQMCCCPQTTAALDAESATVLENIKRLLSGPKERG